MKLEYATDKINVFSIFFSTISLFLTDGLLYFGPREKQYVIGVGKYNLYVLYLGKHIDPPGIDYKPEHVRIISLDLIKQIGIKRLFVGYLCKMSIFTEEEDLVFYLPLDKLTIENLNNVV